ncbi:MAG: metalloregulator ArsR/SmtB family transcription factor [Microbacterium sp.]
MAVDDLSRTFSALADPTRRAILARLSTGEATVGELAEPFAMTFAAVSKHLRVLETAGLVTRGKDAQYRPARLDARPLAAASHWIDDYARFWGDSVDALDHYLNALQQLGTTTSTPTTDTTTTQSTIPDKENHHG